LSGRSGAILKAGVRSTAFPIKQGSAAQRQAVRQSVVPLTAAVPLAGVVTAITVGSGSRASICSLNQLVARDCLIEDLVGSFHIVGGFSHNDPWQLRSGVASQVEHLYNGSILTGWRAQKERLWICLIGC